MASISITRATIIIKRDNQISLFQAQLTETDRSIGHLIDQSIDQNIGMDKNLTILHKNKEKEEIKSTLLQKRQAKFKNKFKFRGM